ncbi:hypothetical protein SALBM311S_02696 [Streptomyces alboniger]
MDKHRVPGRVLDQRANRRSPKSDQESGSRTHCCVPAPSEPCKQLFTAHGSSKLSAAYIPDERAFATKPGLAKAMALRAIVSPLPIAWVTADAARGQEGRLRRTLEETGLGTARSEFAPSRWLPTTAGQSSSLAPL